MNNHEEAGCQAPPAGPILCIQNCGFFGSASNMNMCSKCHKDLNMNQEKAGVAATSTENNVNSIPREHVAPNSPDLKTTFFNSKFSFKTNYDVSDPLPSTFTFGSGQNSGEAKQPPEVPQRCSSCNKRVGLTRFNCRCGHLFCALHRLSEKHDCSYEYRTAGRYAIAKANPVVKSEKLNKS